MRTCLLVLFFFGVTFAQNTITGLVTDNNQPVPSANIQVVGENTGVTTDVNGEFVLKS